MTSSRPCSRTASCRCIGHVVDGYWEDVGTLEAYLRAHQDVLDERVARRHRRLPPRRGGLARRGRRGRPGRQHRRARSSSATTAGSRPAPSCGEYTVLGTNVVVKADAFIERAVVPRQRLHRARRAPAGLRDRPLDRPAARRPRRGGRRRSATSASSASTPSSTRASRSTRSRRSRPAPSSTRRSCGSAAGPARCSAGGVIRGLANVDVTPELAVRVADGVRHHAQEGRRPSPPAATPAGSARALKRAVMAGLNLAGRQRRGPRAGATVPADPLPGPHGQAPGRDHRAPRPGDPQSVEIRFFDADGRRHRRGDPAQDRAAPATARTSGGPSPADIGDIELPAPGPRVLHGGPAWPRSTPSAIRRPAFKVVLDYSFGAASLVMPNVLAKLGADVLSVNPYASTAAATARRRALGATPARVAELVRASGSHLGAVIDPDGETAHARRRRGPRPRPTTQALLVLVTPGDEAHDRRPGRPAGVGRAGRPSASRRSAAPRSSGPSCRPPHLMEVAGRRAASTSPPAGRRVHLPRLPARLRRHRRRSSTCSTCWPPPAGGCPTVVELPARACTSPTRRW